MPEKTIAEELREIAEWLQRESLFDKMLVASDYRSHARFLNTLATRCEGLVSLADVEKAIIDWSFASEKGEDYDQTGIGGLINVQKATAWIRARLRKE